MVILALESSAPSASAAVIKDGRVLSLMYLNVGLTHSVTLLPLVKQACEGAGVSVSELDAVAVTNGPGSFTGVRIGVATAKGIAQPSNIDCIPVSTLEAIAYPLADSDCIAAAVMDARCSQVYSGFFDCGGGECRRIADDKAITFDELLEEINKSEKKVILIGDGADIAFEYIKDKTDKAEKASPLIRFQNAASVGLIAEQKIINNISILKPNELVPSYLRLPQAERELKLRKAKKES